MVKVVDLGTQLQDALVEISTDDDTTFAKLWLQDGQFFIGVGDYAPVFTAQYAATLDAASAAELIRQIDAKAQSLEGYVSPLA